MINPLVLFSHFRQSLIFFLLYIFYKLLLHRNGTKLGDLWQSLCDHKKIIIKKLWTWFEKAKLSLKKMTKTSHLCCSRSKTTAIGTEWEICENTEILLSVQSTNHSRCRMYSSLKHQAQTQTLLYTHKWTGVAVTIGQNWARRLK